MPSSLLASESAPTNDSANLEQLTPALQDLASMLAEMGSHDPKSVTFYHSVSNDRLAFRVENDASEVAIQQIIEANVEILNLQELLGQPADTAFGLTNGLLNDAQVRSLD
jgi:hypothetical protein